VARGTKRSKKSKETDISLEPHESRSSPDDVRGGFSLFCLLFLAWSLCLRSFSLTDLDEEIYHFGH
jgi:hypothetical protein